MTREEIEGLKNLPPDFVRETLKAAGIPLHEPRKTPRTGIDVALHEAGWDYRDALERMAALFPDAVKAGVETGLTSFESALEEARRQAKAAGKDFREYPAGHLGYIYRKELYKWWKALRLDKIDVHTNVSQEAQALSDRSIPRLNRSDVSLYDMLRFAPVVLAISAAGKTKVAPTTLYCKPKWQEGKIGLMIEDLGKPALVDGYEAAMALGERILAEYPPSAIVDTSDRLPQAFYILDQKYPEKAFYDDFMKWLNAEFGDPKVVRQGWDTRLAGLFNKKDFCRDGSGRTPMCKLRSASTRYPIEMERLIGEYRPVWEREQSERPKPEPVEVPAGAYSVPASALGGEEYGLLSRDAFRAELERAYCEEASDSEGFKAACALLEEVEIPDYVYRTGQACEKYELKKWAERSTERPDRSAVDATTARVLYSVGASPHEVYSYMLHHACQNEDWIMGNDGKRHQRVKSPADKDHKARMAALNLAPELWFRYGWRMRHPDTFNYGWLASQVLRPDDEYERRMQTLMPQRRPNRTRRFMPR